MELYRLVVRFQRHSCWTQKEPEPWLWLRKVDGGRDRLEVGIKGGLSQVNKRILVLTLKPNRQTSQDSTQHSMCTPAEHMCTNKAFDPIQRGKLIVDAFVAFDNLPNLTALLPQVEFSSAENIDDIQFQFGKDNDLL